MRPWLILLTVLPLIGCRVSGEDASEGDANVRALRAAFRFDNSYSFRDGYQLQVFRHGDLRWNGAVVNARILQGYLSQFALLPRNAGAIYVTFEPGTPPQRLTWVRRQIVASGLCRQRRCVEENWNAKRPVVY